MFAMLIATTPPTRRWPNHAPSGTAMAIETSNDAIDTRRWFASRCGMPSPPCHCSLDVSHCHTSPRKLKTCIALARRPFVRAPRCYPALDSDEHQVGDNRQHDRQNDADDKWRVEVALVTVLDETAESALVDNERDGDQADRRHRRQSDPGDDGRKRQRQLDTH